MNLSEHDVITISTEIFLIHMFGLDMCGETTLLCCLISTLTTEIYFLMVN